MQKTDLPFMPKFFDRYIHLVPEGELTILLTESLIDLKNIDLAPYESVGDYVYAPGKWTIKDIFQHLIDTERILTYRALCIARNDKTPLPSFDEASYAQHTSADSRTLSDLHSEWVAVRQASVALFGSLSEEMLLRIGTTSDRPMTPLALGFVVLGHPIHHFNVVRELYIH